jgi:hypothetical protein
MMIVFAASVSVLAVLIILAPFFFGKGGRLQEAASINSLGKLEAVKESILRRFLEDERAFEEKRISKMAWEQRRQYLSNRYIDAARRLDFLKNVAEEQAAAKSQGGSSHG